MLRLSVVATSLVLALLAVVLCYPYEYHGGFFIMHDRGITRDAAQVLRIAIPVAALMLVALAMWNVRMLVRWTRGD